MGFKSNELDSKLKSEQQWHEAVSDIYNNKEANKKIVATFVNPFSYQILQSQPALYKQFNYIFSDGALHTKLHNKFCENKINRVSFDFSSIAKDTLLRAEKEHLKVAFIGGKPEHADELPHKMKALFPRLNIAYCRDGYFNSDDEKQSCFNGLQALSPDIVIVGMGTPLQEHFLLQCLNRLKDTKEFYTCGGFLEQTATKGDYYHPVVKKLGLRWLQRALLHSHVRQRILKDYPKFVFSYIKSHL